MYITEAPLHFGLALLTCIVTLLLAFYGLVDVARRGKEASVARFSGVLGALFVAFLEITLLMPMYQLPAAATVSQLLPYTLGAWSFIGLHAFFMVFFFLGTEYFQKRVWAIFLPVIGTLSYLLLVWLLPTPSTVTVVSDGFLSYVAMPLTLIAYAGILAVIYMLLIPLIASYGIAKRHKGAAKWVWMCWFSYFLWFVAALLFALAPYTFSYVPYAFALGAIAWILIAISFIFYERASAVKPKR